MNSVVTYAKENEIDFQPFRFYDLRHRACRRLATGWDEHLRPATAARALYNQDDEGYLQYMSADQVRVNTHGARAMFTVVA